MIVFPKNNYRTCQYVNDTHFEKLAALLAERFPTRPYNSMVKKWTLETGGLGSYQKGRESVTLKI